MRVANCDFDRGISLSNAGGYWRGQFAAMGGPCEVLCETHSEAETERLTRIAADEVWRIEEKFSRYRRGNIVDRINRASGSAIEVDAETAQLIDFAKTLYEISDGGFDITSGVLRKAWHFDGSDNVPSSERVAHILKSVGWDQVTWSRPVLRMRVGMQIDFGGIGKEYAVDRAAAMIRESTDVSCLVNFGGDLAVTSAPKTFNHWVVGIEAIAASASIPANILDLRVGALATSGDARRFLLKDGIRYSHILDPRNGWPVAEAPRSVTVAADTCTQAGMLSTLAILEGSAAEAFLDAQSVQYWCDR